MNFFDPDPKAPIQDDAEKKDIPAVRNVRAQQSGADPRKAWRGMMVAAWVVRVCFAFVFIVNVQCALGFTLAPEAYMGAYELSGVSGRVGIQGIGIAFLMWNCTYPLVIWRPERHRTLAGVVLVQQVVGLIGETLIRATLPSGHDLLTSSIDLFITFDALGLALMGASWAAFLFCRNQCNKLREIDADTATRNGTKPM